MMRKVGSSGSRGPWVAEYQIVEREVEGKEEIISIVYYTSYKYSQYKLILI